MVIAPRKLDIVTYYGAAVDGVPVCYVIQPEPNGLCDAVFRALPFAAHDETVAVGLPDTVWFPDDALGALPRRALAFLLFPVKDPRWFDAVLTDSKGNVQQIQVKEQKPKTHWIWGAFQAPASAMQRLHSLWRERQRTDEYFGTLVNEHLRRGGSAVAVRAGKSYVDVGTVTGYRKAFAKLQEVGGPLRRAPAPGTETRTAGDCASSGAHGGRQS